MNPKKLDTMESMKFPTFHKEVESLNRRLAVLSQFLAKFREKSFPFFQVLRANKQFQWMPECEEAFQNP